VIVDEEMLFSQPTCLSPSDLLGNKFKSRGHPQ